MVPPSGSIVHFVLVWFDRSPCSVIIRPCECVRQKDKWQNNASDEKHCAYKSVLDFTTTKEMIYETVTSMASFQSILEIICEIGDTAWSIWQGSYRPWKVLESPEIKMLKFPGLESPGKRHWYWKTLEKSWNSKVVVLEIYFLVQVSLTREEIHCNTLCAFSACLL